MILNFENTLDYYILNILMKIVQILIDANMNKERITLNLKCLNKIHFHKRNPNG